MSIRVYKSSSTANYLTEAEADDRPTPVTHP